MVLSEASLEHGCTPDELEAIQWDSLEEEMAASIEYDIVPDYDKLLDLMTAAKREASGG